MANLNELMPPHIPSPDSIEELGRMGVLSKGRLKKIRSQVLQGEYPSNFAVLIKRLVRDRILTSYQARMIRSGKADGLVLGRYVLLRPLARGAMGRVYKAYHRMLGRVVVLKLVAPNAPSRRAISRFRREMRLVGRLDHPNIVVAYDADQTNGVFFIAMEYLPGLTLKDLLDAHGPLPPAKVVRYAAEVARGLAHAHARGIVHRDVKPANILLSEGERIKILDLGIGILMEETAGVTRGEVGKLVGTPEYISPEQACQKPLDGRSDLYSLGCTMYHLIQGEPPFSDRSWLERVAIRVTGDHEPITVDLADDPPGLVAVMEKFLARNPEDRFQTADDAAEALLALASPEAPKEIQTALPLQETSFLSTPVDRRRAKVGRSFFAASAMMLALGFGYFAFARDVKRGAPEVIQEPGANFVRKVDKFRPSPNVEPAPPSSVANEPPQPQPDASRGVSLRPKDVAEKAAVERIPRRSLVRRTSIPPRDFRFVTLITLRKFGPTATPASTPIPAPGPPRQADALADAAVTSPTGMTEPISSGMTSPMSKHRANPAPVPDEAEKLFPILEEPLNPTEAGPFKAAAPVEPNVAAKVVPHPSSRTSWPAASAITDALLRKSALSAEARGSSVVTPLPTRPLTEPMTSNAGGASQSAIIQILMPTEKAELVVRGAVARRQGNVWHGPKGLIHTPPLDGTTNYTLRALWTDPSGKSSLREKELKVKPGRAYQVDLRPVTPTSAEFSK